MFVDSPVATVINRQEKLLLAQQLSTTLLVVDLLGLFLAAHLAELMLNQILHPHTLVFLQQLAHLRATLPDRFLAQLLLGWLLLRAPWVQSFAELGPQSWAGFLLVSSEGHLCKLGWLIQLLGALASMTFSSSIATPQNGQWLANIAGGLRFWPFGASEALIHSVRSVGTSVKLGIRNAAEHSLRFFSLRRSFSSDQHLHFIFCFQFDRAPNHALQRTAASRLGFNRAVSWPPSLSLGRWAHRWGVSDPICHILVSRSNTLRLFSRSLRHHLSKQSERPWRTCPNQMLARLNREVLLLVARLDAAAEVCTRAAAVAPEGADINDVVHRLPITFALGTLHRGVPLEVVFAGRALELVLAGHPESAHLVRLWSDV
jgi:hypothetical protein